MKVAYLHALPLEYYPPARNMLDHMSKLAKSDIRAWTTRNRRGHDDWSNADLHVQRSWNASPTRLLPIRIIGYAWWHLMTAVQIAAWRPDILVSVEPHSSLAAWIYYRVFRGSARLFIHHHEFYSDEDFDSPGKRVLKRTRKLDNNELFPRAEWISQTNEDRLRLFREMHPKLRKSVFRVLPNYPDAAWIARATRSAKPSSGKPVRFIYVGSASLEETFIGEVAEWAAKNQRDISLHVVGDNISPRVWNFLKSLYAPNITVNTRGVRYEHLPDLLKSYDIGLVLYKANTLNFIYNVPNKVFEYLAADLEVWYPRQMTGIRHFHSVNPKLPLREIDFRNLTDVLPVASEGRPKAAGFTCEEALAPLIEAFSSSPELE